MKSRKRKPTSSAATTTPPSPTSSGTSNTTAADDGLNRCWKTDKPESVRYHDERWANTQYFFPPSLADTQSAEYAESLRRLFLMQSLELMQAGLSWSTIMAKWAAFERAFDQFDVDAVCAYEDGDVERLMGDPGIVRNRLKIAAIIANARVIRQLQQSAPHGFLRLLFQHHLPGAPHAIHPYERVLPTGRHQPSWMRTDYRTAGYKERLVTDGVHPSVSVVELSRALKRAGFRFMGETVVLSWMQAIGLMNHHAHDCCAFERCEEQYERVRRMFVEEAEGRAERHDDEKQHEESQAGATEPAEAEAQEVATESKEAEESKPNGRQKGEKRSKRARVGSTADEEDEQANDAAGKANKGGKRSGRGRQADGAPDATATTTANQGSAVQSTKRRAASKHSSSEADSDDEQRMPESAGSGTRGRAAGATTRRSQRA